MPDIQDAVDRLAAELDHAVLIEDPQHRPLWWSAQGDVDATRVRSILQRNVSPAAAALVARLKLANATGPVRTPAAPEADMLPRWCVPVRHGRDLLGYLWVLDAEGSVTEADLPAVVACADLAATTLAGARPDDATRAKRRAALLARLEEGHDEDAARELVALEDLSPHAAVVVDLPSAAQPAAADDGWPLSSGGTARVDPPRGYPATSGSPVPLVDLHVAARRAAVTVRAVRAGAGLATPCWEALGSWRLIVEAPDDLAPRDLHPGAEALAARPDLVQTARSVLDHGGDVAAAATELHIHRTTLYYRIERIEKLTGVNVRAGIDRVDLQMALRLLAYRSAG